MADRSDYQEYAGGCICQAEQTKSPRQRAVLLMLAQAWIRLANQSERVRLLSPPSSNSVN